VVRTYWLVQVFNEASWNLDPQPDRTDDQVESISPRGGACAQGRGLGIHGAPAHALWAA